VITNSLTSESNQRGNPAQPLIGTVEKGDAVEVDARALAKEALKVLGKEIGAT
jgi:hypothetical protein